MPHEDLLIVINLFETYIITQRKRSILVKHRNAKAVDEHVKLNFFFEMSDFL
jgi:hypothetical protein